MMQGVDEAYLRPTCLIDSDHPIIAAKAGLLRGASETETARDVFYYIRDEIRYAFRVKYSETDFIASNIFNKGIGFCTQKAILFCAVARAAGIPAGIHFYDIVDHTLSRRLVQLLRTHTLYRHGIAELFLNGQWRQYDATLDIHLTTRHGVTPVEFDPDRDCLMASRTPDGRKHVEYIRDYGLVADVTADEIRCWMTEEYPHL